MNNKSNAISVEIFSNLFRAIVDEMAWRVRRAAHTTFIRETQDFGTALVTPVGEQFAVPDNTGGISLIGIPIKPLIDAITDWQPGDVAVTNDPYSSAGMVMHLNDIFMLRPIFVDGKILCFAWAFLHCSDVGGSVPGSIDSENKEILQEGLRLPPLKLYSGGILNDSVKAILQANCRGPDLMWGDLAAVVASLQMAETRVLRLVERYGADAVKSAMYSVLDRSEKLARLALSTVPSGKYRFTEYLEDDFSTDTPVRFCLTLSVAPDGHCILDYTGSDPEVASAVNLPTGGQKHHPMLSVALMNYAITKSADIDVNAGIIRCIELVLPEQSVVNAAYPAACGARVISVMRLHDLTLGALSAVIPGDVPAAGGSQLAITSLSFHAADGARRVVSANAVVGGSGAGCGLDGVSGTDFPAAALKNVPVEVLETEAPVRVRRFGLRADSEGPGKLRGGFGIEYVFEILRDGVTVVSRGKDRHKFAAWGVAGGGAASCAYAHVAARDGHRKSTGKKALSFADEGDVITVAGGGGGGVGLPHERMSGEVLSDVLDGLISVERARDVYGVVISPDGSLNVAETALRRKSMIGTQGIDRFDWGPGRDEWERCWADAYDAVHLRAINLPPRSRRDFQVRKFRALRQGHPEGLSRAAAERYLDELQV